MTKKDEEARLMQQRLKDNADERQTLYQNKIGRPLRRRQGVEQSSTREDAGDHQ